MRSGPHEGLRLEGALGFARARGATESDKPMPSRRLQNLIALNLALAGGLVALWLSSPVKAQPNTNQTPLGRGRGEYLMIGSTVPGSNASLIQVLDVSNQELITLKWDQGRRAYIVSGYRNLSGDRNQKGER